MQKQRAIAFYLPQFHQIKENDEWWGKGFTEWTNVRSALPLYKGHNQPVRPGDLGYYDITDPSVRLKQAQLARAYGIEGFCYWHYWFGGGRRILERPFNEVLSSGAPDFPFCLCWANQTWTGVWHGAPGKVLVEQTYPGVSDIEAHAEFLARAFSDKRYITIDNAPLFLIYSPVELPEVQSYISTLRAKLSLLGFPKIALVGMGTLDDRHAAPFDYCMPFGPSDYLNQHPLNSAKRLSRRISASGACKFLPGSLRRLLGSPIVRPFSELVDEAFEGLPSNGRYLPCVLTGWDNTPRSKRRGVVIEGYTPTLLKKYIQKAVAFNRQGDKSNLIFFKAWNEWAEGNTLEPTLQSGLAYLEILRDTLAES